MKFYDLSLSIISLQNTLKTSLTIVLFSITRYLIRDSLENLIYLGKIKEIFYSSICFIKSNILYICWQILINLVNFVKSFVGIKYKLEVIDKYKNDQRVLNKQLYKSYKTIT